MADGAVQRGEINGLAFGCVKLVGRLLQKTQTDTKLELVVADGSGVIHAHMEGQGDSAQDWMLEAAALLSTNSLVRIIGNVGAGEDLSIWIIHLREASPAEYCYCHPIEATHCYASQVGTAGGANKTAEEKSQPAGVTEYAALPQDLDEEVTNPTERLVLRCMMSRRKESEGIHIDKLKAELIGCVTEFEVAASINSLVNAGIVFATLPDTFDVAHA
eukprot:GHVU01103813.1.p2 GENE.GHVU01103813.1~~GHVU01103813.1.p2  ORF type:complete len:217 (-),score=23.00 GHVU01103813.1:1251-1901(-)